MAGWTLDDIAWDRIDRSRASPEIVSLVRAASMVESNAADYRDYLCNVFADDPRLCAAVAGWACEEQRHGAALARWATLVDSGFDFDTAFRAFLDGYRIPVTATESVRGSRCGELIARCMVETGTSSFYTALSRATDEPVLQDICRRIAADEFAHYAMFYRHMRRYLDAEKLGFLARLRVALVRIAESDDDELSYAYFAANGRGEAYDRRYHGGLYQRAALSYYTPGVMRKAIEMVFTAVGLNGGGLVGRTAAIAAGSILRWRQRWLARTVQARSESRSAPNSRTAAS